MSGRSIFWISGWSIPPDWLADVARRHLPGWEHAAVAPSPRALDEAATSGATILGGFSFGAHLLLASADPRPRLLLAPFPDLKSEAGLGGAVATTRIRQQLRQLRRDPAAAVADFRRLIGAPDFPGPTDPDDLAWGLEQMLAPTAPGKAQPAGTLAFAGNADPLLDLTALCAALPGLRRVPGGHDPGPLLAAAAPLVQAGRP